MLLHKTSPARDRRQSLNNVRRPSSIAVDLLAADCDCSSCAYQGMSSTLSMPTIPTMSSLWIVGAVTVDRIAVAALVAAIDTDPAVPNVGRPIVAAAGYHIQILPSYASSS